MPKRQNKTSVKKSTEKKKATVSVNPSYDAMPDVVDNDAARVFKMAFLEMRHAAINNKLAIVAQEYEKKQLGLNQQRTHDLNQVKAELAEADRKLKACKDELEKEHGIALRCYTYDDETGVLTKQILLEQEAREEAEKNAGGQNSEQSGTESTIH